MSENDIFDPSDIYIESLPAWIVDLSTANSSLIVPRRNGQYKRVDVKSMLDTVYHTPYTLFVVQLKWRELGYVTSSTCYMTFREKIELYGYSKSLMVLKRGEDVYLVKDPDHILRLEKR